MAHKRFRKFTPRDTDPAMRNLKLLRKEVGATLMHICRVQVSITGQAIREAVYQAMGKWPKGVHAVSTEPIVQGLAWPERVAFAVMAVASDP